jgi:hypothetical protein
MLSCSREKPDNVFMNGLPELGFTIDYACFLNQDSATYSQLASAKLAI